MKKKTLEELQQLLRIYRKAREKISLALLDYTPNKTREIALLSEVNKIIKELEQKSTEFVEKGFTREYKAEIKLAEGKLDSLGIKGLGVATLSTVDKKAIDFLVSETQERLIIAVQGIQREVLNKITQVKQSQIRELLEVAIATGESTDKTIKEAAQSFRQDGIQAFVAKDGRKLNVETYAKTIIRNNIQQAHNEASYNRYVEAGVKVVKYSVIRDERVSAICAPREGKYFYIDTVTPLPWGSHFNCRHTLIPVARVPEGVKIYSGYPN